MSDQRLLKRICYTSKRNAQARIISNFQWKIESRPRNELHRKKRQLDSKEHTGLRATSASVSFIKSASEVANQHSWPTMATRLEA
jgi:hypothetical protein